MTNKTARQIANMKKQTLGVSEAEDHTAQTLTNLANIMATHEQQIGRAIKISESRTEQYCRIVNPEFLRNLNATFTLGEENESCEEKER